MRQKDKLLREKFTGQPEHVINYLFMVAEEAREIMAKLGIKSMDELVGRVDLLKARKAIDHWKSSKIDLTPLLVNAEQLRKGVPLRKIIQQDHGIKKFWIGN
ncbi:MAG: hypothetical protein Ct9H300mP6_03410 [Gammaproteobacteria bacterium]|nr:MAG: hypothetical protein Ct9H300mP6_03410 [Gammaproteobacteria bacterium]